MAPSEVAPPPAPTSTFVFTGAGASVPAAPELLEDEDDDDENDATVVSDRRSSTGWKIVLDGGAQQGVSGQVLIGRLVKKADPRWPAARLLSIADTTKSMSKVHALFEADATSFSVTDLGSTNGVIITTSDGTEIDLASEATADVPAGSTVTLGNYVLRVEKD